MNSKDVVIVGIILGVSLIFSSVIVANTFYKVKALDNTLTVTGSAKKVIVSDVVKWSGSFSRTVTVNDLKSGYSLMAKDLEEVKKFFKGNGFGEESLVISPIFMDENYYGYKSEQSPKEYNLRQTIEVQSSDVEKITNMAKNISQIIDKGVIFSSYYPEYYYSKLGEIRIELLSEAVKDARNRADKIAESGNRKVSNLKNVSVGVTQVMPINSTDISDYGTYDTTTINKEVTITVKATFVLK